MAVNAQGFLNNYVKNNVKGKFRNEDLEALLKKAEKKGHTVKQKQINNALNKHGTKLANNINWSQLPSSKSTTQTSAPVKSVTPKPSRQTRNPPAIQTPAKPAEAPVQQTPKQYIKKYLNKVLRSDNELSNADKNALKQGMIAEGMKWDRSLVEEQLGEDKYKGITLGQKLNNNWNPPATVAEAAGMPLAPPDAGTSHWGDTDGGAEDIEELTPSRPIEEPEGLGGADGEAIITGAIENADGAEPYEWQSLLDNMSAADLANLGYGRLGAGDTTETTQTVDGNDNTTIGGDDNSLTLKPDNSEKTEFTGDIKGNKGLVNIGQGDLFNWQSDYDWFSADDNRKYDTTIDYKDWTLDSHDDTDVTTNVIGNNNYTDSSITKITSMGDGPALDNYAATHAYGNLLKKGNKGYGARHASIAQEAIGRSPISQTGLGYMQGYLMGNISDRRKTSNHNAFGGLMSNNWNINYEPRTPTQTPDL